VTSVPKGTKLAITGTTKNGKAQIVYQGHARWVTAQYLAKHEHHSASSASHKTVSNPATAHAKPATYHKTTHHAHSTHKTTHHAHSTPRTVGVRYASTTLANRLGPGTGYRQDGQIKPGEPVKITGHTSHGKAQIVDHGKIRWVTAKYLSKTKPSHHKATTASSSRSAKPTSASVKSSRPTTAPSASSKGQTALQYAKAQLGKPYSFGAAGPSSFDCSGLTMRAWQAAGVNLPHLASAQLNRGPRVSMNNLKPGDIVFFYPNKGVSHNGIYAGNGMVIDAPHTGTVVRYDPISAMPVAGATRPG
jgi:cell wall-associated NlpC family hydrolase